MESRQGCTVPSMHGVGNAAHGPRRNRRRLQRTCEERSLIERLDQLQSDIGLRSELDILWKPDFITKLGIALVLDPRPRKVQVHPQRPRHLVGVPGLARNNRHQIDRDLTVV
jgi:hypothetical protein